MAYYQIVVKAPKIDIMADDTYSLEEAKILRELVQKEYLTREVFIREYRNDHMNN